MATTEHTINDALAGLLRDTRSAWRNSNVVSKNTVTPSLKIDDKLLSDILSDLYPPKSPYEFSVIANSVHSSWSVVPGTEDRKPRTKN